MNQKLAIILLGGFIGGVAFRSFIPAQGGPASGWVLIIFFIFLALIFLLFNFFEKKKLFLLISLFIFSVSLGMARYEIKDMKDISAMENKTDSWVELTGVVIDEPDERENYTRLIVESENNKILIYAPHYPEFNYGDEISLSGILKKPSNLNNDFDWVSYLGKDDIYFEMFYPKIDFISSGNGSWIKRHLFLIKKNYLDALAKVIPEPHSSFVGGLTIGAKQNMPKDLQEDFRKTGIIHIVVLSGYNITLIADNIIRFFSFLPSMFSMSFGVAGIIFFAIMTGASATVVRASVMAILAVIARATGRIYEITWILFLTGFLMILQNPKILRFDAGFQLSFLATLSLIFLAPYFEKKIKIIPEKFQLRGIVSSTIATQIFVLPLLLYKMGMFSLVSLPVNFLVLVFVPITMLFGFIAGGLGMVSTILSIPFGWISYFFLQYELWVVEIFAKLPFASIEIEKFPLWLMLAVYVIYFLYFLLPNRLK